MLPKKLFGDDHEIRYDSIINHDTYDFLRVSLEVPRGQDARALILLMGKEVGMVEVHRAGKTTLGYSAYRKDVADIYTPAREPRIYRELGQAITAILLHQSIPIHEKA